MCDIWPMFDIWPNVEKYNFVYARTRLEILHTQFDIFPERFLAIYLAVTVIDKH